MGKVRRHTMTFNVKGLQKQWQKDDPRRLLISLWPSVILLFSLTKRRNTQRYSIWGLHRQPRSKVEENHEDLGRRNTGESPWSVSVRYGRGVSRLRLRRLRERFEDPGLLRVNKENKGLRRPLLSKDVNRDSINYRKKRGNQEVGSL